MPPVLVCRELALTLCCSCYDAEILHSIWAVNFLSAQHLAFETFATSLIINYLKVILNELVRVHVPLGKASHNRTQTYSSELNGQNRQMPTALLLRNYALLSRCPQKLISQNGNTEQAHSWNILHSEFHLQYFSISPVIRKGKSLLEQQLMLYPQVKLYLDHSIFRQATVLYGSIQLLKIGNIWSGILLWNTKIKGSE